MSNIEELRKMVGLGDEALKRQAEGSLLAFVKQAWHVLERWTEFLPNWHIECICEHLEDITLGGTRRLVFNMPPRYGKSLLVSVMWPVWEWLRAPETRWLCVSYADTLAIHHSLARRRLILSPWYQRHWQDRFRLTPDQNEKGEFSNSRGGIMTATSMGGTATGKGGNRIVVDDPHNPTQAESDLQRQHGVDFFGQTLSTRLNDKRHGAIVVVHQRLHELDLTAHCLDLGYTHLNIPAIAETRTTVIFPRSRQEVTREVGDVLWPAREDADDLEQQKLNLGSYGFAGQYQQSPSPRAGGMFQRVWWRYYDELPGDLDGYAQSWDAAAKGGTGHDYTVGLVAARKGADIYLIDRYKAQPTFPETVQAIQNMHERHPAARTILIEDTANGSPAIETLRSHIPGIIGVRPKGSKEERAAACTARVEAGNVYLPSTTAPNGQRMPERAWVDDFIEQLARFPKGAHDDDVDAFTQLLLRWNRAGYSPEQITAMLTAGGGERMRPPEW